MILEIQHETRLEYSDQVKEWFAEVRMEPVSDSLQSCHSFHLAVNQSIAPFRYQDGFGNRVHHFNLLNPPTQVCILAASVVETAPDPRSLQSSRVTFPLLLDPAQPELAGYLQFGGPVRKSALLEPLIDKLKPADYRPAAEFIENVREFLFANFEYAVDATNVSSPIDDLLAQGKGVCQDFAHLMIAILRWYRVPARYVSGYLHRPNKESQSHAWCEAWLPDLGWVGVDPTNNCQAGDNFVRVAIGRDFTDVPPNKGIYRGKGTETILVRVESRQLERVPSLSWQEELPSLDVPLKVIRGPIYNFAAIDELGQQQQQQQ